MASSQDISPPPPNQGLPVEVIEREQGYRLTQILRLAASSTLTIAVVIFCLQGYYNKNRDRQYELQILLILLGASGSITADLIVAKIRSNQLRHLNATALRDQEMKAEVRRKISRDDFLGMVEQVKVVSLTLREEGVEPEVRRIMLSQLEERYLPAANPLGASSSANSNQSDLQSELAGLKASEESDLQSGVLALKASEEIESQFAALEASEESDLGVRIADIEAELAALRATESDSEYSLTFEVRVCLGSVDQVVFSPDDQRAVTAQKGGIARLWELGDLADTRDRQLAEFRGAQGDITQVAFSSDGQLFAISWHDGVIRVYDLTGSLLTEITGQQGDVTHVLFSPYARLLTITGQEGTSPRLWDASGEQLIQLQGKDITKMSFNDQSIAINDMNGHVLICDSLERYSAELNVGDKEITHMVFSPGGRQLVVIELDGYARLWDIIYERMTTLRSITQGEGLPTNKCSSGHPTNAVFSPNGESLATTYQDGTAVIWDSSGRRLYAVDGHGVPISDVVFSHNAIDIAVTYQDGTARLWVYFPDGQGESVRSLQLERGVHDGAVVNVVFSPNDHMFATTHQDGTAYLWDKTRSQPIELEGDKGPMTNVVFSPNDQMLATTHQDGTAFLWDTRRSQPVELEVDLQGDKGPMTNVVFSPKGRMFASTINGKVYVFSIKRESRNASHQ